MSFVGLKTIFTSLISAEVIEPSGLGFLGNLLSIIGTMAVSLWQAICSLFYTVCMWFLALVDFLQYFIQKLIGLDYWLRDGNKTFEGAIESDLLFSFLYNETVQNVFRAMMGIFFLLLIVFTIFAIIKQEWTFATGGFEGGDGNSKVKILRNSMKAIALVLVFPLIMVIGIISSNAILASLVNALSIDMNQTFGSTLFSIASQTANKYRVYADDENRRPVTQEVTFYVDNSGKTVAYSDGSITGGKYTRYISNYETYLSAINNDCNKYTVNTVFELVNPRYEESFSGYCISMKVGKESKYFMVKCSSSNKTAMYYYLRNQLGANVLTKSGNSVMAADGQTYRSIYASLKKHIESGGNAAFIRSIDLTNYDQDTALIQACYNTWGYSSVYDNSKNFAVTNEYNVVGSSTLGGYGLGQLSSAKIIYNSNEISLYYDGGQFGVVQKQSEYLVMADVVDFINENGVRLYMIDATSSMIKWNVNGYTAAGTRWLSSSSVPAGSATSTPINIGGSQTLPFIVSYSDICSETESGNVLYTAKYGKNSELDGTVYIMCWKYTDGTTTKYVPLLNNVKFEDPYTQDTYTFKSDYYSGSYTGLVVAKGTFETRSTNASIGEPTYIQTTATTGNANVDSALAGTEDMFYYTMHNRGYMKPYFTDNASSVETYSRINALELSADFNNITITKEVKATETLWQAVETVKKNDGTSSIIEKPFNPAMIQALTIRLNATGYSAYANYAEEAFTADDGNTYYLFATSDKAAYFAVSADKEYGKLRVMSINAAGNIQTLGVETNLEAVVHKYTFHYKYSIDGTAGDETADQRSTIAPKFFEYAKTENGQSIFQTVDQEFINIPNKYQKGMYINASFKTTSTSLIGFDSGAKKITFAKPEENVNSPNTYTLAFYKFDLYNYYVGAVGNATGYTLNQYDIASKDVDAYTGDPGATFEFNIGVNNFSWDASAESLSLYDGKIYVGTIYKPVNQTINNGSREEIFASLNSATTRILYDGKEFLNMVTQNRFASDNAMKTHYNNVRESLVIGFYRDNAGGLVGSQGWVAEQLLVTDFNVALFGGWRLKMAFAPQKMTNQDMAGYFTLEDGVGFDYFFERSSMEKKNNEGVGFNTFFVPQKVSYWLILIASALIIKILGTSLWGVIKRFYEITLYFVAMPAVASTIVFDDGEKFKSAIQMPLITKVLSTYGVILGINMFFVLLAPVRSMSNIFTEADMKASGNLFLKYLPIGPKLLNYFVYVMFMLVAFTMIDALPKAISQIVSPGPGGDIAASGKETMGQVGQSMKGAGDMISGRSAINAVKKGAGFAKDMLAPGRALISPIAGKAKNFLKGDGEDGEGGGKGREGDDGEDSNAADGSSEAQGGGGGAAGGQGGTGESGGTSAGGTGETGPEGAEGNDGDNTADGSLEAQNARDGDPLENTDGMSDTLDGVEVPQGADGSMEMADGAGDPDAMEMPEGGAGPDAMEMPEGDAGPDAIDAEDADALGDEIDTDIEDENARDDDALADDNGEILEGEDASAGEDGADSSETGLEFDENGNLVENDGTEVLDKTEGEDANGTGQDFSAVADPERRAAFAQGSVTTGSSGGGAPVMGGDDAPVMGGGGAADGGQGATAGAQNKTENEIFEKHKNKRKHPKLRKALKAAALIGGAAIAGAALSPAALALMAAGGFVGYKAVKGIGRRVKKTIHGAKNLAKRAGRTFKRVGRAAVTGAIAGTAGLAVTALSGGNIVAGAMVAGVIINKRKKAKKAKASSRRKFAEKAGGTEFTQSTGGNYTGVESQPISEQDAVSVASAMQGGYDPKNGAPKTTAEKISGVANGTVDPAEVEDAVAVSEYNNKAVQDNDVVDDVVGARANVVKNRVGSKVGRLVAARALADYGEDAADEDASMSDKVETAINGKTDEDGNVVQSGLLKNNMKLQAIRSVLKGKDAEDFDAMTAEEQEAQLASYNVGTNIGLDGKIGFNVSKLGKDANGNVVEGEAIAVEENVSNDIVAQMLSSDSIGEEGINLAIDEMNAGSKIDAALAQNLSLGVDYTSEDASSATSLLSKSIYDKASQDDDIVAEAMLRHIESNKDSQLYQDFQRDFGLTDTTDLSNPTDRQRVIEQIKMHKKNGDERTLIGGMKPDAYASELTSVVQEKVQDGSFKVTAWDMADKETRAQFKQKTSANLNAIGSHSILNGASEKDQNKILANTAVSIMNESGTTGTNKKIQDIAFAANVSAADIKELDEGGKLASLVGKDKTAENLTATDKQFLGFAKQANGGNLNGITAAKAAALRRQFKSSSARIGVFASMSEEARANAVKKSGQEGAVAQMATQDATRALDSGKINSLEARFVKEGNVSNPIVAQRLGERYEQYARENKLANTSIDGATEEQLGAFLKADTLSSNLVMREMKNDNFDFTSIANNEYNAMYARTKDEQATEEKLSTDAVRNGENADEAIFKAFAVTAPSKIEGKSTIANDIFAKYTDIETSGSAGYKTTLAAVKKKFDAGELATFMNGNGLSEQDVVTAYKKAEFFGETAKEGFGVGDLKKFTVQSDATDTAMLKKIAADADPATFKAIAADLRSTSLTQEQEDSLVSGIAKRGYSSLTAAQQKSLEEKGYKKEDLKGLSYFELTQRAEGKSSEEVYRQVKSETDHARNVEKVFETQGGIITNERIKESIDSSDSAEAAEAASFVADAYAGKMTLLSQDEQADIRRTAAIQSIIGESKANDIATSEEGKETIARAQTHAVYKELETNHAEEVTALKKTKEYKAAAKEDNFNEEEYVVNALEQKVSKDAKKPEAAAAFARVKANAREDAIIDLAMRDDASLGAQIIAKGQDEIELANKRRIAQVLTAENNAGKATRVDLYADAISSNSAMYNKANIAFRAASGGKDLSDVDVMTRNNFLANDFTATLSGQDKKWFDSQKKQLDSQYVSDMVGPDADNLLKKVNPNYTIDNYAEQSAKRGLSIEQALAQDGLMSGGEGTKKVEDMSVQELDRAIASSMSQSQFDAIYNEAKHENFGEEVGVFSNVKKGIISEQLRGGEGLSGAVVTKEQIKETISSEGGSSSAAGLIASSYAGKVSVISDKERENIEIAAATKTIQNELGSEKLQTITTSTEGQKAINDAQNQAVYNEMMLNHADDVAAFKASKEYQDAEGKEGFDEIATVAAHFGGDKKFAEIKQRAKDIAIIQMATKGNETLSNKVEQSMDAASAVENKRKIAQALAMQPNDGKGTRVDRYAEAIMSDNRLYGEAAEMYKENYGKDLSSVDEFTRNNFLVNNFAQTLSGKDEKWFNAQKAGIDANYISQLIGPNAESKLKQVKGSNGKFTLDNYATESAKRGLSIEDALIQDGLVKTKVGGKNVDISAMDESQLDQAIVSSMTQSQFDAVYDAENKTNGKKASAVFGAVRQDIIGNNRKATGETLTPPVDVASMTGAEKVNFNFNKNLIQQSIRNDDNPAILANAFRNTTLIDNDRHVEAIIKGSGKSKAEILKNNSEFVQKAQFSVMEGNKQHSKLRTAIENQYRADNNGENLAKLSEQERSAVYAQYLSNDVFKKNNAKAIENYNKSVETRISDMSTTASAEELKKGLSNEDINRYLKTNEAIKDQLVDHVASNVTLGLDEETKQAREADAVLGNSALTNQVALDMLNANVSNRGVNARLIPEYVKTQANIKQVREDASIRQKLGLKANASNDEIEAALSADSFTQKAVEDVSAVVGSVDTGMTSRETYDELKKDGALLAALGIDKSKATDKAMSDALNGDANGNGKSENAGLVKAALAMKSNKAEAISQIRKNTSIMSTLGLDSNATDEQIEEKFNQRLTTTVAKKAVSHRLNTKKDKTDLERAAISLESGDAKLGHEYIARNATQLKSDLARDMFFTTDSNGNTVLRDTAKYGGEAKFGAGRNIGDAFNSSVNSLKSGSKAFNTGLYTEVSKQLDPNAVGSDARNDFFRSQTKDLNTRVGFGNAWAKNKEVKGVSAAFDAFVKDVNGSLGDRTAKGAQALWYKVSKKVPEQSAAYTNWNRVLEKKIQDIKTGGGQYATMSRAAREAEVAKFEKQKIDTTLPANFDNMSPEEQRAYKEQQLLLKHEAITTGNISSLYKTGVQVTSPKKSNAIKRFADNAGYSLGFSGKAMSEDVKNQHKQDLTDIDGKIARYNATKAMRNKNVDFGANFNTFVNNYLDNRQSKTVIDKSNKQFLSQFKGQVDKNGKKIDKDFKFGDLTQKQQEALIQTREDTMATHMNTLHQVASKKVAKDAGLNPTTYLEEKGIETQNVKYKDGSKKYTHVQSKIHIPIIDGKITKKRIEAIKAYEEEYDRTGGEVSAETRKKYQKSFYGKRSLESAVQNQNRSIELQKQFDKVTEFNRNFKGTSTQYAAAFKAEFGPLADQLYAKSNGAFGKVGRRSLAKLENSPVAVQQRDLANGLIKEIKKTSDRMKYGSAYIPATSDNSYAYVGKTMSNAKTRMEVDLDRKNAADASKEFKQFNTDKSMMSYDSLFARLKPGMQEAFNKQKGKKFDGLSEADKKEALGKFLAKEVDRTGKIVHNNNFLRSDASDLQRLNGVYVQRSRVNNSGVSRTMIKALSTNESKIYQNVVNNYNSAKRKLEEEQKHMGRLGSALTEVSSGVQSSGTRNQAKKIKEQIETSTVRLSVLKKEYEQAAARKNEFEHRMIETKVAPTQGGPGGYNNVKVRNIFNDYRFPRRNGKGDIEPDSIDGKKLMWAIAYFMRRNRSNMDRLRLDLESMVNRSIIQESSRLNARMTALIKRQSDNFGKSIRDLIESRNVLKEEIKRLETSTDAKDVRLRNELQNHYTRIDNEYEKLVKELGDVDVAISSISATAKKKK